MSIFNAGFTLGVIPARGGSKGVPRKNIKNLGAKPLIFYTIEQALKASSLDMIVVSTDCPEVAELCKQFDSVGVIKRPEELAKDTSKTESALLHACDYIQATRQISIQSVVTLEPTSPFRTSESIDKCMGVYAASKADSVVTVVEFNDILGKVVDDNFVHLIPNQPRRRQDRESLYKESSAIYCTNLAALRKHNSVLGDSSVPVIIPAHEAFDINEPLDFVLAEAMLTAYRSS